MKFRKNYCGLVLVLVLFGCSSVQITKVPSKTPEITFGALMTFIPVPRIAGAPLNEFWPALATHSHFPSSLPDA